MYPDRFFRSTRGRIVAELRRRGSASAADLAAALGISPNAVRQQLVVLERDGYVVEHPVRRGPTKPTLEFSLTDEADRLFPQAYDRLLSVVLREVRARFGDGAVSELFEGIARRATAKARRRITGATTVERVQQIADLLREEGVQADVSLIDGGVALHEHNCPYGTVAKEHPEVCSVIHHVLGETTGLRPEQVESLATGGKECRFEVRA
jgi:predicted ArsR family transcriptional regulator